LNEDAISEPRAYDAVLFDLLSGLVDSWSLWDELAGNAELGRRWRMHYLEVTYGTTEYSPYLSLVAQSAEASGLPASTAIELRKRWDQLEPWPEAPKVVSQLASLTRVGVVTNCSEELGQHAASRVSERFEVTVTAERSGFYKPDPRAYGKAIADLGVAAERILYVAGSPFDVRGASAVGMPVYWHNRIGLMDEEARSLAVDTGVNLLDLKERVS